MSVPEARGSAHAKTILLGEHAVVHGHPAIAFGMPELTLSATARLLPYPGEHAARTGELTLDVPSSISGDRNGRRRVPTVGDPSTGAIYVSPGAEAREDELAQSALLAILTHLGQEPGRTEVHVEGAIPTARGLGSSAAMSSAIADAVSRLHGVGLSTEERFEIVQTVEKIAHGTPSGLDAYATMAPRPIWFQRGRAEELELASWPALLVADTGIPGRTLEAVAQVRTHVTQRPEWATQRLEELARLTVSARDGLRDARWSAVGEAMNSAHGILDDLGVSHPRLDHLVRAAREAGAVGAKLTGGGQGGCMIALAERAEDLEEIRAALMSQGAAHVWRV